MLALGLGVMLLGAACGARTAPYLGSGGTGQGGTGVGAGAAGTGAAPDAGAGLGSTVGAGSGTAANAGSSGRPGAAGIPAGGSAGSQAGAPPVAAPALTPANFPFTSPAAQAGACPGAAGNGSSDVGISPAAVNVGNVSGLTGVLANNFEQGSEAVQALFSAINAAGGICGRQLKLQVEDDGQDSTKNSADIADLAPKVFAFVGSTSDADNGGVVEMANAKVPDFGQAINSNRGVSPTYWSAGGSTLYTANGHPELYDAIVQGLKANGNFPKRIATLAFSVPISADAAKEYQYLFTHEGSTSCFTDYSISPATASLDQDVLQMKNNGCDGVYTTMDVTGNAKLLQAMKRQGFSPRFAGTTFDGYTPAQVSVAGADAAQGFEVSLPFIPFSDNNPIVSTYVSQLKTYEPGKEPSSFGLLAWASAEMFVYALIKSGHNPTRAALVNQLQAIDSWNTGGATSTNVPRLRQPSGPCTVEAVVKGSDFVRKWPPAAYFCTGQLVPVG
ncbi:MAG: hypothetical protein NVS1B12_03610 [Acidimicrobiales bacterium]